MAEHIPTRIGLCTHAEHEDWWPLDADDALDPICPEFGCDAPVAVYVLLLPAGIMPFPDRPEEKP